MPAFTLPIKPLRKPSCLNGQQNGKLRAGILKKCGIGNFLLAEPAARACRALVAAAEARGFKVRATGTYRTYAQQESLFRSRYTVEILKGRPTKRWEGQTWYQLPKTAMAAVPGTSNHGWGLAVDFAEELDGDAAPESVSPKFVKWLIKNAATYGFSAELQSEPWHWRYVAGDNIPAAVLAWEETNES
jgi:LAS superfamily LD-carboxypeptidase LdcB